LVFLSIIPEAVAALAMAEKPDMLSSISAIKVLIDAKKTMSDFFIRFVHLNVASSPRSKALKTKAAGQNPVIEA
jgi:hypothetical protein